MRPYYGHPPACTCAVCAGTRPRGHSDSGDGDDNDDWQLVDCPTCEGTGRIYAGWSNPDQGRVARCPRCLGKGKIRQRRSTPRRRRRLAARANSPARKLTQLGEPTQRRHQRPTRRAPAHLGRCAQRRRGDAESARGGTAVATLTTGAVPRTCHQSGAAFRGNATPASGQKPLPQAKAPQRRRRLDYRSCSSS